MVLKVLKVLQGILDQLDLKVTEDLKATKVILVLKE